ncbi:MAG: hypothetical protein ACD_4C00465G0002 [uncultured bacterium (gcode 4)]|uniref:Uncharacterized protein n=1 Tax=uncultured bacterium (gcode 4) TaxID=1234023 RepID=K2FVY3_9BACT|nr:MAG: hypothetical protein ACD_4C00465G0002 [uncultured bacterium (gcode 4)]
MSILLDLLLSMRIFWCIENNIYWNLKMETIKILQYNLKKDLQSIHWVVLSFIDTCPIIWTFIGKALK